MRTKRPGKSFSSALGITPRTRMVPVPGSTSVSDEVQLRPANGKFSAPSLAREISTVGASSPSLPTRPLRPRSRYSRTIRSDTSK